jgi:hypothetical protein
LARLCSDPEYRWATRVCLRLWRETAARCWEGQYDKPAGTWPVKALVSYSNAIRHKGDLYRFDGWRRVGDVKGSTGGGTWTRNKKMEPKTVWAYEVAS